MTEYLDYGNPTINSHLWRAPRSIEEADEAYVQGCCFQLLSAGWTLLISNSYVPPSKSVHHLPDYRIPHDFRSNDTWTSLVRSLATEITRMRDDMPANPPQEIKGLVDALMVGIHTLAGRINEGDKQTQRWLDGSGDLIHDLLAMQQDLLRTE